MKNLLDLIKAQEGVSQVKLVQTITRSTQVFYVKSKVETVRATDTEEISATVYCLDGDVMGDSVFAIYPSMREAEVVAATAKAVARARLVHNKAYSLPTGDAQSVVMPSNLDAIPAKEVASRVARAVFGADTTAGGSINALEIFVKQISVRVLNSRGLDHTQTKCELAFEAIPTYTEGDQSVELYQWYDASDMDLDAIGAKVAAKMREVSDRYHAQTLAPCTMAVVLRPSEFGELAFELAHDFNYATIYNHANAYSVGDDLQEGRTGDPLNISRVARVQGSSDSAVFDEDGLTLQDKAVVVDGKAVGTWGSNRYGQYMDVPTADITGVLPCISVGLGSMQDIEGDYLEVVSMSGIQLDIYNDYIGGEVRLAYLHRDGTVLPVTGISLSGSLSKVLPALRLSGQSVDDGDYHGPAFAYLPDLQIV